MRATLPGPTGASMSKLYVDEDRYGEAPSNLLVETVRNAVTNLVRRRFAASAVNWSAFVFDASDRLITPQDFADIERQILDTGYRFEWSAVISQSERPDIYCAADDMGADLANFSFEHPEAATGQQPDSDGRAQCGFGEHVVRRQANAVGVARYVRSSDRVIEYMKNGVPDGTIAIIDDSGGTLTAPILEHFAGIVCAGGTVRSHL